MNTRLYKLHLTVIAFYLSFVCFSQEEFSNTRSTIFQSIAQEDVLEIQLVTDLERLINDRKSDEYIDAQLIVETGKNPDLVFDVEVQVRGKFRRRVCDFPPFKVKFSRDFLRSNGFQKHNKLKVVTHCLDNKLTGNDNVVKEYLAYQIYNEITPNSYQVQLLKITYIDEKGKLGKIKRYGVLIEDTDEMADRVGGDECECRNSDSTIISASDENKLAVFQYMIGNEDWDVRMLRNLKLVERPDRVRIPVPYDFDFSGLINASYAIPNTSDLGLESITQRYYLGYRVEKELLDSTLDLFASKEKTIYKLVRSSKYLSSKGKQSMVSYLKSFYDQLDELYAVAAQQSK